MKYLKLFEKFNVIENDNIILEILNDIDLSEFVNEEFGFKYYYYSDNTRKKLEQEHYDKLIHIEDSVKKYIIDLYPLNGKCSFRNKEITLNYLLEPTEHWFCKFFRKNYEDSDGKKNYSNPSIYEGVNIIKNNINYITEKILDGTIKTEDKVLIKTKDSSKYTLLIFIQELNTYYNIKLISQMKGSEYHSEIRTLKLHPNGPL